MERAIEQMMDYIVLLGPKEWRDARASVIIRDILLVFSERIEQDVQLVHIWEDLLFDYVGIEQPIRIREALDLVAEYTGSRILCHDTRVSFVQRRNKWMNEF